MHLTDLVPADDHAERGTAARAAADRGDCSREVHLSASARGSGRVTRGVRIPPDRQTPGLPDRTSSRYASETCFMGHVANKRNQPWSGSLAGRSHAQAGATLRPEPIIRLEAAAAPLRPLMRSNQDRDA